jgi:hypothetical protein
LCYEKKRKAILKVQENQPRARFLAEELLRRDRIEVTEEVAAASRGGKQRRGRTRQQRIVQDENQNQNQNRQQEQDARGEDAVLLLEQGQVKMLDALIMQKLKDIVGEQTISNSTMQVKKFEKFRGERIKAHLDSVHKIKTEVQLRAHEDFNSDVQGRSKGRQMLMPEALKNALVAGDPLKHRTFKARELQLLMLARNFTPINSIEDHATRLFHKAGNFPEVPYSHRASATKALCDLAVDLKDQVLRQAFAPCGFLYLTCDSVTIWHYRYLMTIVHAKGVVRALPLDVSADFEVDPAVREPRSDDDSDCRQEVTAAKLTADSMNQHLRSQIITKLENEYKCVVVSMCTDNASSMKNLCVCLGVFDQRCLCHAIQLVVRALEPHYAEALAHSKDIVEQVSRLSAQKKEAHHLNSVCAGPATRWNSVLLELQAVKRAHDDQRFGVGVGVNPLSVAAQQRVADAIQLLRPYETATKIAESDSSTMISALHALATIRLDLLDETEGEVPAAQLRQFRKHIMTMPLLITAFFCRCVQPNDKTFSTVASIMEIVMQTEVSKKIITKICPQIDSTEKLKAQFNEYLMRTAPNRTDEKYSATKLLTELADLKKTHALLGRWVEVIANITPSEASAERCGSKGKLSATRLQTRMSPKTVESRIITMCASEFYFDAHRKQINADADDVDKHQQQNQQQQNQQQQHQQHQDQGAAIDNEREEALFQTILFVMKQGAVLWNEKLGVEEDVDGIRCAQTDCPYGRMKQHPTNNFFQKLMCASCGRAFNASCAGVPYDVLLKNGTLESWKCERCHNGAVIAAFLVIGPNRHKTIFKLILFLLSFLFIFLVGFSQYSSALK